MNIECWEALKSIFENFVDTHTHAHTQITVNSPGKAWILAQEYF